MILLNGHDERMHEQLILSRVVCIISVVFLQKLIVILVVWAIDILNVLHGNFVLLFKNLFQFFPEDWLSECKFALKRVLYELMVCTVEVIKDPSVKEFELLDSDSYVISSQVQLYDVGLI